ncbi:MAG: HDOD domain-containing protein [Pseudomonadota bacterium]
MSQLLGLAAKLSPISELNEANRLTICKSATVINMNRSTDIPANKEHRWFTYVLEGQVEVFNTKEKAELESIASGSDRSNQPVLKEFTQQLAVKTKTTAQMVRFGRELFDILLNEQQKTATKVHDIRVTEADNVIFDSIVQAFEEKNIALPCQADIGQRIASLVSQGTMGIPELSRILASDPALTAHTLHEANKIASSGETTQTMRGAITRLGVESANQLGVKIPSEQKWQAANPVIETHMANYQKRATITAAICKVFAKSLPHLSDERAHLIGLMADVGELMILGYANDHADQFTDAEQLRVSARNLREIVGMWLLSAWGFNENFVEAVESARDFYRNHTGEISYADLVTAALLTIESEMPEEENKSIPSVVNLLLPRKLQQAGIDLQNPKQILQEAALELKELHQLLN